MTTTPKALLTYNDLAKIFDKAVAGLESNEGDELMELGSLLHFIGLAKEDSFCFLAADALGNFGVVINEFYPLIATPYHLQQELKASYDKFYKTAKDEGVKAIKQLKHEFCENDIPDGKAVITVLGIIQKHSMILSSKRNGFIRTQAQGSSMLPIPPE